MAIFTIGFTKTSAEHFFSRLEDAGVRQIIDVRLRNSSQLAGFAKATDLAFFLRSVAGIPYQHAPELAPDARLFTDYRRNGLAWEAFELRFLDILAERKIEDRFTPEDLDGACLLCSEDTPHHCHRRLVAEYLEDRWQRSLDVVHL